jgi:3'(2'), 5'-bisphosphate nucleotidase
VQELLLAAFRDADPALRACRVEAEEAAGDLGRFATTGDVVIAIDPIDGTRIYRDRAGPGYAVMVHLRTPDTVEYSLVYLPEDGPEGSWLEATPDRLTLGPDDPERPARPVLDALPALDPRRRGQGRRVYVTGFPARDRDAVAAVIAAGLEGVPPATTPGSIYPLLARGEFAGALLHTPNVYDFPVIAHVARLLGGDAIWVHDGRPVHFREVWLDKRSSMLRLPGIVACAVDRHVLETLARLARDWSPVRS